MSIRFAVGLRLPRSLGITLFVALVSCGGGEQQGCLPVACPVFGLRVTIFNPPPDPYRVEATAAGQITPLVQNCATGGQCQIFFMGFRPDMVNIKIIGAFDTNTYDVAPTYTNTGGCGGNCGSGAVSVTFAINRSPNGGVSVYKSRGVQCASLLTLADLEAQLTQAAIPVISASCGNDGMLHAAMCGAPDGRVGIFEVAAADVATAQTLGFADVSVLPPEAQRTGC